MPALMIDPDGLIFEAICQRIEEGESLRGICAEKDMPAARTVIEWKEADEGKRQRYARARLSQARVYAERINEVAENALNGLVPPDVARVAIDAFKWTASKMDRTNYGDTAAGPTINVGVAVTVLSEERRAELLAKKQLAIRDNESQETTLLPRGTPAEQA